MMLLKEVISINDWEKDKPGMIQFWQSRKIQLIQVGDEQLSGKRGSLLGNLFAFNMQKLMTELSLKKIDPDKIELQMDISTKYQHITKTNAEYWELEIRTFQEFLLNGGLLDDEWLAYNRRSRKSNMQWVLYIVAVSIAMQIFLRVF